MWTLARRLTVALCIAAILFAAFGMPDAAVLPWFLAPVWLVLFVVVLLLCRNAARPASLVRPLLLVLPSRLTIPPWRLRVSIQERLRKLLVVSAIGLGLLAGVPMRPDEIDVPSYNSGRTGTLGYH
jgi:hypothetical protein